MSSSHRRPLVPALLVALFALPATFAASALADVPIRGEVCNLSKIPVSVEFYHHNTIGDLNGHSPFTKATLQPCSCIAKQTHTDLWHNPPVIQVKQLAYTEIAGSDSYERTICLEASRTQESRAGVKLPIKKALKGYVEYKSTSNFGGNVCESRSSDVRWRSTAPQIDYARSNYRVLADRQTHTGKECNSHERNIFGGQGACKGYNVVWLYDDGTGCYGSAD